MKLIHWIFIVCLWTASCDLILVINVGGSLRVCQLLLCCVIFAALIHAVQQGRILWAKGSTALSVWLLTQFLFLPAAGESLDMSAQVLVLLVLTVLGVFAAVQLYGNSLLVQSLMKAYLASFVFVSLFGLVQFTLPLLGLPSPLVTQYIILKKLARINGFSHEPSFFATYVLMGWIMLLDLGRSGAELTRSKIWKGATIVVTLALILSTSKSAWVFMLVEGAVLSSSRVSRNVRLFLQRLQAGVFSFRKPRPAVAFLWLFSPILLSYGFIKLSQAIDPWLFLAGTGIGNTASHSASERTRSTLATWDALKDNPWIGRSLGGVPIYIAGRRGFHLSNFDEYRKFWGFPVPLEVLVASGIIGFIPFVLYVWSTTFRAARLARRSWPGERARWLRALARAMIYEWFILLLDQNLLRVYVWFHMTMVLIVSYQLEFGLQPLPQPQTSVPEQLPLTAPA